MVFVLGFLHDSLPTGSKATAAVEAGIEVKGGLEATQAGRTVAGGHGRAKRRVVDVRPERPAVQCPAFAGQKGKRGQEVADKEVGPGANLVLDQRRLIDQGGGGGGVAG